MVRASDRARFRLPGEAQKIGFLFIGCFVALLPLVIKDIADVPAGFTLATLK